MIKRFLQFVLITIFLGFLLLGTVRIAFIIATKNQIINFNEATIKSAVIVPGAGLNADGTPSNPLKDRVDTAINLYKAGKVQKILLSGDNRFEYYNEPEAMRQYALSHGVPDSDLVLDYAGRSTYETCYRAKAIFYLDDAYIVTQAYHLPRAVFLCRQLGLNAEGVAVEQSRYIRERYLFWNFREVFATMAAAWEVFITKPLPVLGEPEPIFSY